MPACLPTANWTTHWPFGFGRRGARRRPHRQERPARSCRYVAQAVFGRLAGYEDVNDAERLRHDPAMRWIVGGKVAHGCAVSPSRNGAVRDAMAHDRKEPIGACRSFRPMDRQGSSPPSAARRRARHGFERQPDARRTGAERLERPLRMHLLSSPVRVQPVRRSGALRPPPRQCSQRR
jgi:hypothetical protein